jgi:protease II
MPTSQCITPASIIDFNMKRKAQEIKKEQEVLEAFDKTITLKNV